MSVSIFVNGIQISYVSATWSGTENQAARKLDFTVPSNPYDKNFDNPKIALGDPVDFYDGKKLLYRGIITSREKTGQIGTASYESYDYMHYLLRSNVTKVFKNKTPKKITVALCKMIGLEYTKLEDPKVNIKKVIYQDKPLYDIIVAVYRKAYAAKGGKYMPTMVGGKLSVIIKGTDSGVTLDQATDITGATFHDTTNNMVNQVKIFDQKRKQKGQVRNKKQITSYGTYQQVYTMESKEKTANAKKNAEAMLVGITKEASVEAIGDVRAVAGKALVIHDSAAGISGIFYISSDTHTFQNGVHTMSLELNYANEMETGAEEETETKKKKKK